MTGATPRRLHPATVLIRVLTQLPSTLLSLPALFVMGGRNLFWIGLAFAGIAALSGIASWLQWRAFTYAIGADELVIAEGVLARSRRTIPLARVQDVSVERAPLARLFGVAVVRIETGGDAANEGLLNSVSLAEAGRLRDVLRRRSGTASVEADTPKIGERPIFAMDPRRVLTMGLFRFSLVWIAAIYAALQSIGGVVDIARWIDAERIARDRIAAGGTVAAALAIVILIPVAAVLGVTAGLIRTALTEWGFRLAFADGRFRRTRGLLTRTEVVVALNRVQLSLIERGLVSRRFGWASLAVQTLGGSDDVGGRQMMAPFARPAEIAAVIDRAGLHDFAPDALRQVARGHATRSLIRNLALPLAIIAAAAVIVHPAFWFGLTALPILGISALLARRRHRWGLVGDTLQVARGVATRREWVVPIDNIQAVTVTRGWLQRRLGLATVIVGVAGAGGRRPDVEDLTAADAAALAHRLTAEAA